jgi:membrane protease YdiL (CAAX protease family)
MLLFLPVYLLAAAGEELGWSGYVLEPLQHRFGALGGTLVLGVLWWRLHVPSIRCPHRRNRAGTQVVTWVRALSWVRAAGTR